MHLGCCVINKEGGQLVLFLLSVEVHPRWDVQSWWLLLGGRSVFSNAVPNYQFYLDTCVHHTCTFSIDFVGNSQIVHVSFYMWSHNIPMHENNAIKFSKCEPNHEFKQEPWDIARHKSYLKVLYNTYTFLLLDNLMDNFNMAILSMEPRKWIITLHNNYCLTSHSISCRHFTWLQKCCNC